MSAAFAKPPRYGVEPASEDELNVEPPFCPHGPTLVFERYYADREPRKFYACAVHRDRKGCPFFHWVDEKICPEKRERWMHVYMDQNPQLDRSVLLSPLESVRSLPESERVFCHTCSLLLSSSAVSSSHSSHQLQYGVGDSLLNHPTRLLVPQDHKKSNAQYFFSDSTCQLLLSELTRLKVTGVLCLGTPRLHENILNSSSVSSLLLDIDNRYAQFYPPSLYQRYNMFNGHFYEDGGQTVCQQFLQSPGVVAMVIDPPFGGLAEVLSKQIFHIWSMAGKELKTLLVYPYFLEQHVNSALPSLVMSDYQVTYENHKHFSSINSKKPSPVRFFTNLSPPGPRLPRSEGYHLCRLCQRYVAPNNAHCAFCNSCTSKDGRKYRHCDECEVCVKPGRRHCRECGTCQLPEHICGKMVSVGCHICGSMEHKRRDCPAKNKAPSQTPPTTAQKTRKRKRKNSPVEKPKPIKRKHSIDS